MSFLSYIPFPEVAAMEVLEQILFMNATVPKPVEVRVAIAGGDDVLHGFLCAYLFILQSKADWLQGITLKFFLVPFEYNTVAAYIARHDGWYARHVWNPSITDNVIVPHTTSEKMKDEDTKYCPLPGRILRDLNESYIRDAHFSLKVFVWQVEGWMTEVKDESKDDKMAHLPDQRIPFMCSVEVAQNREEGAKEQEWNIRCTTMDFRCKEHVEPESVANFQSVHIANVPTPENACANPQQPWLEAFVQTRGGQAFSGNVFGKSPRQHVSKIEIQNKNEAAPFTTIIDGKQFGPFVQIRVTKICHPLQVQGTKPAPEGMFPDAGTPFVFPIQTFTPIATPF